MGNKTGTFKVGDAVDVVHPVGHMVMRSDRVARVEGGVVWLAGGGRYDGVMLDEVVGDADELSGEARQFIRLRG